MVTMGLFAPLPLALMIPFMAAQSFAMGEAFGKGFQYGKRRISAQTNEEFNKMSAKDHFNETTADIKSMIPEMKQAMSSCAFLQQDIIKELIGYIKATVGTVVDEVKDIHSQASDDFRAFFGLSPTVAKLVSPAGINALINWWNSIGLPAKTDDAIRARLKLDFTGTPTFYILQLIKDAMAAFIGPLPPSGGVSPPPPPFGGGLLDEDTRADEPPLDAINVGKEITFMVNHGYILNPTPRLVVGATSKRRKTQSTELELNKLILAHFNAVNVGREKARVVMRNPADGPSRSKLRIYITDILNPAHQKMVNFAFTYI